MSANQLTLSTPGDLMRYLDKSKSAIAMALPNHMTPERMMRLALTCFSSSPALRKCTAQSILASIVVAGQIGLEPGIVGQGYLIPYKTTCTFVPGWQGLVGLLNNTGRATAWTGAVFEGDEFDFRLGSNPRCHHIPGENFGDPEKLKWVYACGKVNGSETPVIEAWPLARVWKHLDRYNKVGDRHYAYENPEMYARKVVLLQVLKYMPRSIELNNAIAASDAAEMGKAVKIEDGVIIDVESEDTSSTPTTGPIDPFQKSNAATEPAASAPAADHREEREQLFIDIRETMHAAEITLPRFEALAKEQGLMQPAETMAGGKLPIERMRAIHASRGAIAGLFQPKEGDLI